MPRAQQRALSSERERQVVDAVLILIPVAFTVVLLARALPAHFVASDFHTSYYPAVRRMLYGGDPYAATRLQIAHGTAFPYPPVAAVVLAPFALLGQSVSDHIYLLLCVVLVPASVWAVGTRDPRTYAIPLLWLPAVVGWEGGNVSVPLTFLVALAWRYRNRAATLGLIVALVVSLKAFAWPLGLWLLATRRWRASLWALASGAALNLVAAAIVGFGRIDEFLHLSGRAVASEWRTGYSMLACASHLGLGRSDGELLLLAVSTVGIIAVIHRGLVRRQEREAMALAVALMLLASPVVWSHYFVLLVVPIGLTHRQPGPLWLAPVAMWVCPVTTPAGWQLALAWIVVAGCLVQALRGGQAGPRLVNRRQQAQRPTELAPAG